MFRVLGFRVKGLDNLGDVEELAQVDLVVERCDSF